MASTSAIEGTGPMVKVKGRAMVIASTEPSPGMAPTTMPKTVPATIAAMTSSESRSCSAPPRSGMPRAHNRLNQGEVGNEMCSRNVKTYQVTSGKISATSATGTTRR